MSSSLAQNTQHTFYTAFGKVTRIPLSSFLHIALPPLRHDVDIGQVSSVLNRTGKKSSASKPITLRNRWKGFPEDPIEAKCPEKQSFKYLQDAVAAVIKAGRLDLQGHQPLLSFRNNPDCEMYALNRKDSTFPDAYLFRGDRLSWKAIAVSGEYKKAHSEEDEKDNVIKVLASMSVCMQKDPCRRFTLGFTIENTRMSFWFSDRSQILVSEPFNFITNREPFIHFFLAVMYAEPPDLGWDPTMIPSTDGHQYDITVHPINGTTKTYRTLKLLSHSGAEDLRSKGTRVWRAILIEDGKEYGEPVILKDVWADSHRRYEGEILEDIRSASLPADMQRLIEFSFLTVVCHGDVFLDPQRTILDCTRSITTEDPPAPFTSRSQLLNSQVPACTTNRKVHYRIVFKEDCKPIHEECSVSRIFRALGQTACTLHIMHAAGWVHRDVSTGNILLENHTARLADMEYAKKAGQGDECRLGTRAFIAVEIDSQDYTFLPLPDSPLPTVPEGTLYEMIYGHREDGRVTSETPAPISLPQERNDDDHEAEPTVTFRYNALHDLESLWWIAVYFVFDREVYHDGVACSTSEPEFSLDAQRRYAMQLFHDRDTRWTTLTSSQSFRTKMQSLHPTARAIARLLEDSRARLAWAYHQAEADISSLDPAACADEACEYLGNMFLKISRAPDLRNVTLRPFCDPEYVVTPGYESTVPSGEGEGKHDELVGSELNLDLQDPSSKKAKRVREAKAKPTVRTRPYLPRKAKPSVKRN